MKKVILKRGGALLFSLLILFMSFGGAITFVASAAGEGAMQLGFVGETDTTLTLNLQLTKNPGIVAFGVKVSIPFGFSLASYRDAGLLKGDMTPEPSNNTGTFYFSYADDLATTNNTATGTVLTFVLNKPAEFSETEYFFALACDERNNVKDCDMHKLAGSFSFSGYTYKVTCRHEAGDWETLTEANCTDPGKAVQKCKKCFTVMQERAVEPLGHTFGNPKTLIEATCTKPGLRGGVCSRCTSEIKEEIPATGHSFDQWKTKTEPTCTEKGEETRKCKNCNEEEKRDIEPLGHEFENPKVVKEATLWSEGKIEGKCLRCGESTSQAIPCTATDPGTGASIEAEEGTFPENAEFVVTLLPENSREFEETVSRVEDRFINCAVYRVRVIWNRAEMRIDKKVKLFFAVPEGFGSDLNVYWIGDDTEEPVLLSSVLSENGKEVFVESENLGYFLIGDLTETPVEPFVPILPENNTETSDNGQTLMILGIAGAAALALGIGLILFVQKKTEKKEEKSE